MIVSLIVALSENGVIGLDGAIPWRLPPDLKLFKQLTMGHHLILGRKTFQSIGRPLPGRKMVVLSRQPGFEVEGCRTAPSLEQALEMARTDGETEAFIGGGAVIYAQALQLADRIYLSRVHAVLAGDTFFPSFDEQSWQVIESQYYPESPDQQYAFTFKVLERNSQ
jgi:dihydrofolate reductase